jgi:hydroxymethylglutaryl-CoA reductase
MFAGSSSTTSDAMMMNMANSSTNAFHGHIQHTSALAAGIAYQSPQRYYY